MLAKNEPGATAVNVRLFNPNAATGGCFEDEFVSTAVRISSISTDDTSATPVAVRHIWPWLTAPGVRRDCRRSQLLRYACGGNVPCRPVNDWQY